jgi:hypothetical protein
MLPHHEGFASTWFLAAFFVLATAFRLILSEGGHSSALSCPDEKNQGQGE